MLRIGICDDEREALESHTELVRHIMQKMGMNADIRKCHTGNELLMEMEENGKFDIILLDIEMEYMNGIESARKIVSAKYSCGFSNLLNPSIIVNEI